MERSGRIALSLPVPEPSPTEQLPPPSAELVLWRVQTEAIISVLGRRKGERFLRVMADKLANEENMSAVFQIRPSSERGAVSRARQEAAEIFKRLLPLFLARLR